MPFLTPPPELQLSDCHRHERASITNEIFILPNVRIIGAGAGVGCRRVFVAGVRGRPI